MKLLFDIETNGLDFSDGNFIDRVHTCYCLVIMDVETNKISRYYDTDGLRELGTGSIQQGLKQLEQLGPNDELIGHNIIQFDVPVLRKLYRFEPTCRIYDTLVASRTLFPDRTGGHSLGSWGDRLGCPKIEFDEFGYFSLAMLEYCEQDVITNARVYKHLKQEERNGDWQKALDLEHKVADIIARQERNGFYFDQERARQYLSEWEQEIDSIDNRINRICGKHVQPGPVIDKPFKINGEPAVRTGTVADKYALDLSSICGPFSTFDYKFINLESKAQQKELLLELGWKPEAFTPAGGPKLDDSITKVGPIGSDLLRRNVLSHRRSQVQGFLDIVDQNSRIHGGANPCGTNTSRMKHQRIVNIPRATSPFGAEMRSLFGACSGRTLVGYDAASLELRILAHYIGNEEYNGRITTNNKSEDAHTLAARAAGLDDRDVGKTINYALIYGAGDKKLGSIIGGGEEAGVRLRSELYNRIPGLGRLVDRAKSASKRGYVISLDGRKLYTRPRVSPLNTLIQGGGSIFMKTVAVQLDKLVKDRNIDAIKVVDMHDEAQWECHPKDVDALSSCINEAFVHACSHLELRCPQEAEIKVGQNWMETH